MLTPCRTGLQDRPDQGKRTLRRSELTGAQYTRSMLSTAWISPPRQKKLIFLYIGLGTGSR
jgi:hypothetical protein